MDAPPSFSLDAIAVPLARGERPVTWGLNLNAFPQAQAELAAPYDTWAATASPLLEGSGAYLYPSTFLHVTASSPAPFTNPALAAFSSEDRAALEAAWLTALRAECTPSAVGWPARFSLTFRRLQLCASCAIFSVDDPAGGVAAVRACVAAAAARVAAGPAAHLHARSGWKSPNIVHSTIMRLVAPAEPGVDLAARWAAAAELWPAQGVTIECPAMTFLREIVPYQHMDPVQHVVEVFPYRDVRVASQ